jgi:uncharacterized protein (TIGR00255 family)
MVKSMTGFGAGKAADETLSVAVEIKSLNSKGLDVNFRLPKTLSDKEVDIRTMLTQQLERGKVNLSVEVQTIGEVKPKVSINRPLMKAYYRELAEIATEMGAPLTDVFRQALQMPEVLQYDSSTDEQNHEWTLTRQALQTAISACNDFRRKEGEALAQNLTAYITKIGTLLQKVSAHDPDRIEKIKTRIRNRITEVVNDDHFDPNRFEQEMIYYLEKLDISEEKVRLQVHLDHFMEVLRTEDAPGKKLNFIAQEIGREINTIGSKANDATIQRYVVEMKEELEKIKEQSLNIL